MKQIQGLLRIVISIVFYDDEEMAQNIITKGVPNIQRVQHERGNSETYFFT